jgi:hypothetical protein
MKLFSWYQQLPSMELTLPFRVTKYKEIQAWWLDENIWVWNYFEDKSMFKSTKKRPSLKQARKLIISLWSPLS